MRSEMVCELGCRFGKLTGRAADQSNPAASAAGIRVTAAGVLALALVRFIKDAFPVVHRAGGDDADLVAARSEVEMKESGLSRGHMRTLDNAKAWG